MSAVVLKPSLRPKSVPTSSRNDIRKKSKESSEELAQLVGRPLVPFYTPEGDENTHQQVDQSREFGLNEGEELIYRRFVNGYFVPTRLVCSNGKVQLDNNKPTSSRTKRDMKTRSASQSPAKASHTSKGSVPKAVAAISFKNPSNSGSADKWANSAAFQSPQPEMVPLPEFLQPALSALSAHIPVASDQDAFNNVLSLLAKSSPVPSPSPSMVSSILPSQTISAASSYPLSITPPLPFTSPSFLSESLASLCYPMAMPTSSPLPPTVHQSTGTHVMSYPASSSPRSPSVSSSSPFESISAPRASASSFGNTSPALHFIKRTELGGVRLVSHPLVL